MTEDEIEALEDEAEWDWDNAEVGEPVERPLAEVHIILTADELERISARARQDGMRAVPYIRSAALKTSIYRAGFSGTPTIVGALAASRTS